MRIGSKAIAALKVGAQTVQEIRLGSILVFPLGAITVVDGGVQPATLPLINGQGISAAVPLGADALANYETSTPGGSIASVVVTATINGSDVGIISQNTA